MGLLLGKRISLISSLLDIGAATDLLDQVPQEAIAGSPTVWHWVAFGVLVAVLLWLDLGLLHRHSHEPTLRQAAVSTLVWCTLALAFNLVVWLWRGPEIAILFLTGYVVEWSLSMDNVFVFAVIFAFFGVPVKYQYRVLFWGIIGAVMMRLSFILVGAELLERFEWVLWIFGAFLIYTGIKLAISSDSEVDPERNFLMKLAKRWFPVAHENHGSKFWVVENGRRCITPLFLVLLVVESTDVLFAVDSVPASLAITRDRFTVFTSNVFAILGLRALYFLLAGSLGLFRYLNYGLSAVLVFVGLKMVLDYWLGQHLLHPAASLAIIMTLLAISIIASLIAARRENGQGGEVSPLDTAHAVETPSRGEAR